MALDPAESYREALDEALYFAKEEADTSDYADLLQAEADRVRKIKIEINPVSFLPECYYQSGEKSIRCNNPSSELNGQPCSKWCTVAVTAKQRIAELEDVLRATRARLRHANRTTLAIDAVL